MDDDETRLLEELNRAEATGQDCSSLLCDLASLKLSKGEDAEAEQLFRRVADLRSQDLADQAAALAASEPQANSPSSSSARNESQNASIPTPSHSPQHIISPDQPTSQAPYEPTATVAAPPGTDEFSEDDWETCFDTGKIEQQLEDHVSSAAAQQPHQDDDAHQSPPKLFKGRGDTQFWRRPARPGYEHVVEVYGLSKQHKTSHLEDFLLEYQVGAVPANIRWVDDNHALIVCASQEAARALLEAPQPKYKLRAYEQASDGAQEVAYEELAPPRGVRPKTTSAVAKRLLSHALNRPELRDREAEKQLAAARRQSQQERRERQQQAAAVWDDP